MEFEELAALAVFLRFFRRGEFPLGKRDAALLRNSADGFGESDIFDFLDEGEDVAVLVAPEAVEELAAGVDGEGGRLFFVERTEAGEVLGSGLLKSHVVADDFDDVGLFFDVLGEVGGHR
jgi:hypothetical protein